MIDDAEVKALIAEREAREAAAESKEVRSEQLEYRAQMATLGGAAFGVLGLVACGIGLLVFRDIMIATFGAGIGLVGFGVVTAAQWAQMRGRNSS